MKDGFYRVKHQDDNHWSVGSIVTIPASTSVDERQVIFLPGSETQFELTEFEFDANPKEINLDHLNDSYSGNGKDFVDNDQETKTKRADHLEVIKEATVLIFVGLMSFVHNESVKNMKNNLQKIHEATEALKKLDDSEPNSKFNKGCKYFSKRTMEEAEIFADKRLDSLIKFADKFPGVTKSIGLDNKNSKEYIDQRNNYIKEIFEEPLCLKTFE